jgi:hypothetical protein
MKRLSFLLAVLCLVAVDVAFAVTDGAREFDQLTLERDRALAAASEPINRRYQAALEQLLRRATQANDLDTAVRIKAALARLSTTAPPGSGDSKAEVIGTWKFTNNADGHTGIVEINADNTYSSGGKQIGRWDIEGKQIVITLDQGGHQDRYDLPVRGGKLEGKNKLGHPLTLRRKAD